MRAGFQVPEEGIAQPDDNLGSGADPLGDVILIEAECGDQAGIIDFKGGDVAIRGINTFRNFIQINIA